MLLWNRSFYLLPIYLIALCIICSCNSSGGPLFLESPPKKPTEAEKACADFSSFDHKKEYLITAAKNHTRAEKFNRLLLKLENLDDRLFEYMNSSDRFVYTLLLPSNEAVEAFYEIYKPTTLTERTNIPYR